MGRYGGGGGDESATPLKNVITAPSNPSSPPSNPSGEKTIRIMLNIAAIKLPSRLLRRQTRYEYRRKIPIIKQTTTFIIGPNIEYPPAAL
jgi:hypothetical protein